MSRSERLAGAPALQRGCCAGALAAEPAFAPRARAAWRLTWARLAWMGLEGALGLVAGYRSGSSSLVGWAFGSAVALVIAAWSIREGVAAWRGVGCC